MRTSLSALTNRDKFEIIDTQLLNNTEQFIVKVDYNRCPV